jgi:hypothetical protein
MSEYFHNLLRGRDLHSLGEIFGDIPSPNVVYADEGAAENMGKGFDSADRIPHVLSHLRVFCRFSQQVFLLHVLDKVRGVLHALAGSG